MFITVDIGTVYRWLINMFENLKTSIIVCINKVLDYLRSGRASDIIVGSNVSGDVSKEFDIVAEDILTHCITSVLDDVVVVGEERGIRRYGSGKWIAVIDPVDGSSNFDAGIPWSSVSVAVARRTSNNRTTLENVVLAIVAEIFRDRMYIYRDGSIEFTGNGISRKSFPKSILLGYFETPEAYRPVERYVSQRGRVALRSLGSAALDIVYVALGNAEGFIDVRSKLRNVDIAAALKIALTMGAKAYVCNFTDAMSIPLDDLVKIACIAVGYDEVHLLKLVDAIEGTIQHGRT